jgi:hypothetical protein
LLKIIQAKIAYLYIGSKYKLLPIIKIQPYMLKNKKKPFLRVQKGPRVSKMFVFPG